MNATNAEAAAIEELAGRTRIVLRPIAGPLAIGFFGLAGATFTVAGLQLAWIPASEGKQVALSVLAFTVPLQFVASVFAFLARDGVVATGMGLSAASGQPRLSSFSSRHPAPQAMLSVCF